MNYTSGSEPLYSLLRVSLPGSLVWDIRDILLLVSCAFRYATLFKIVAKKTWKRAE